MKAKNKTKRNPMVKLLVLRFRNSTHKDKKKLNKQNNHMKDWEQINGNHSVYSYYGYAEHFSLQLFPRLLKQTFLFRRRLLFTDIVLNKNEQNKKTIS